MKEYAPKGHFNNAIANTVLDNLHKFISCGLPLSGGRGVLHFSKHTPD